MAADPGDQSHDTKYFRLRGPETSHCSLEHGDRSTADDRWRCRGCGSTQRNVGAIDVRIQELAPEDQPLSFINGSTLGIVRLDLLLALNKAAAEADLFLGGVRNSDGVLPGWVTVHGRHETIVRGTRNASHRRCSICGRHLYFGMGTQYLFPQPPPDATFLDEGLGRLIVRSSVLADFDALRWPGLRVEPVKILQKPKDGLGCFD